MLYNKNETNMPTIDDLAIMSPSRLKLERIRLKTEVAFIRGDAAHGGPARTVEVENLNRLVKMIEDKINGGTNGTN